MNFPVRTLCIIVLIIIAGWLVYDEYFARHGDAGQTHPALRQPQPAVSSGAVPDQSGPGRQQIRITVKPDDNPDTDETKIHDLLKDKVIKSGPFKDEVIDAPPRDNATTPQGSP